MDIWYFYSITQSGWDDIFTDQTWASFACYGSIRKIRLCMNNNDKVIFTQFIGFVLLELMHKNNINLK